MSDQKDKSAAEVATGSGVFIAAVPGEVIVTHELPPSELLPKGKQIKLRVTTH